MISGMAPPEGVQDQREPIRILVVADQELFRRGLVMLIGVEDDIVVVGEASDGDEAALLAEATVPDVVLLDVRTPRRSGIDACRAIKQIVPSAKIIMLTMSDEEADLYNVVTNGASGYLLKDASIDEVARAVRLVVGSPVAVQPVDGNQDARRARGDVPGRRPPPFRGSTTDRT